MRRWLAAALLAAGALAGARRCTVLYITAAAARAAGDGFQEDLKLGTGPGMADVADNGHVTAVWLTNPAITKPGGEFHSDFFVEVPIDTDQPFGRPRISADDSSIAVPAFVPGDAGTITSIPTRLRVYYHCRKPGTVGLQATVPLQGYNDLVWKWHKQCTDDVPVHLNMGAEERGADVIHQGVVVAAWNASSPTVSFPPMQTAVALHLSTSEEQAFYEPEFEVDPPIAVAAIEGHFDPAVPTVPDSFPHDQPVAMLAKNQDAPFLVRVACEEAGVATIAAHIRPYALFDGFRPISIGWRHQCGGVPRPGLAIASQILHEGVNPADADVARGGAVNADWNALNYTADAQQTISIFHYAILGDNSPESRADTQQWRAATVTVDPPIATAALVDENAQVVADTLPAAVATRWTAFGLRLRCNTTAERRARVTVVLRPGVFDPIAIRLVKVCGGFKRGMGVTLDRLYVEGADDDMTGAAAVVRDGVALASWRPAQGEPATLAEPTAGSVPFLVRLGSGAPAGTRHSSVLRPKSGKQGVGAPRVGFADADDADWLDVAISGALRHGGVFKEGVPHSLILNVTCPSLGFFPSVFASGFAGRTARLTLTLPLVGFQPAVFGFQQRCDGWIQTPLGASLFAVFVILLVAGCYFAFISFGLAQRIKGYLPVPTSS